MIKRPDFAEELRAEARRAIAVAHQYRLDHASSGMDAIFLFFEGLDDKKYYLPLVQRFKRVEMIHSYTCDGKREVVEAWKILERWGLKDLERALFFLDRDHDRCSEIEEFVESNIFITSGYSVENYLVSTEAVNVVLSQYTTFSGTEVRSHTILAEFQNGYEDFVARMRPMMAWCIRVRARGEKPNLANVNLKKIVNVEAGGRIAKLPCAFRNFRKACRTGVKLAVLEYRDQIMKLRNEPIKCRLRGKYEL